MICQMHMRLKSAIYRKSSDTLFQNNYDLDTMLPDGERHRRRLVDDRYASAPIDNTRGSLLSDGNDYLYYSY